MDKQQTEINVQRDRHQKQQAHDSRNARISQSVINILGRPDGLRAVQVRLLWEDHYRVNVLIGADAVTAKIANSYFVQTDSEGTIIKSTPMIAMQLAAKPLAAPARSPASSPTDEKSGIAGPAPKTNGRIIQVDKHV